MNVTHSICECGTQYQGIFCESIKDLCSQKNCINGGNCIEISDEAYCECLPGYQGDLCEVEIQVDFCANSPCGNATCVNKQDDYECICGEGVIGKRCHLQPCDYDPCPKNSLCINLKNQKTTKNSFK